MRKTLLVLVALFALFAAPACAESWGDSATADYPKSKAICQRVKALKLPTLTPAEKSGAPCDSVDLYEGVKHPADPAAARICALNHVPAKDSDDQDPFDGRAMLATIYANGKGAPRDLDIALGFACQLDGASAEMDSRILHLEKLKTEARPAAAFDICDDATSSLLIGACASRDADRDDAKRDAAQNAIESGLTPAQKPAFAKLRKAERAYAKAASDNEVDMSGTLGPTQAVGAEQTVHAHFMTMLDAVTKGTLPEADATAFSASDKALNATFAKIMRTKDDDATTITRQGIRVAQKAWLGYRDAFIAFAKVTTPRLAGDAIKTALTKERTTALADVAP